jgi:hypothetical protein
MDIPPNTVEQRDVQCRQVVGGFVLAGNRRFNSTADGTCVQAQTIETVTTDTASTLTAITNFMNTGAF